MSWRAPDVYVDGQMTTAKRVGLPVMSSPIPRNTASYLLTEEWEMQITDTNSWTPLALNTAHPEATGFILVEETERKDIGVSQVHWQRRYAKMPGSYDEWETFPYNFIGYFGPWGGWIQPSDSQPTGRNRQTLAVESRVTHDFFLVAPPGAAGAAGSSSGNGSLTSPYDVPGSIPANQVQKYRLVVGGVGSVWWMDIDFLSNNPPYNFQTTPSRKTYEGYVINALAYGWQSGRVIYKWAVAGGAPTVQDNSEPNPGQIVAEDSRLQPWQGNIWVRQTRYILAQ